MNAQAIQSPQAGGHQVCPWWLAYFFDNPLRRLIQPAGKVLGPYLTEGMTTLDFGCGFGHFSLGMARLVGDSGRVFAADVQQKMLDKTMKRARKAGLDRIIQPLLCDGRGIGAALELDFALACNSLHETPDPAWLLSELFSLLKPGGRFQLMEPPGHLKMKDFEAEVALAKKAGFVETENREASRKMTILLNKPGAQAAA